MFGKWDRELNGLADPPRRMADGGLPKSAFHGLRRFVASTDETKQSIPNLLQLIQIFAFAASLLSETLYTQYNIKYFIATDSVLLF